MACECLKNVFGNYVQCVKTGRFVDYEYWHDETPDDCPLEAKEKRKDSDG